MKMSKAAKKARADVTVTDNGSTFSFNLISQRAKDWVNDNTEVESWQWLGGVLVVDHRPANGLFEAMQADGLDVLMV